MWSMCEKQVGHIRGEPPTLPAAGHINTPNKLIGLFHCQPQEQGYLQQKKAEEGMLSDSTTTMTGRCIPSMTFADIRLRNTY